MELTLDVHGGPAIGRRIVLEPGSTVRVGRSPSADFTLIDDRLLSGIHFQIVWDGEVCRIRDMASANGTRVAGRRVKEATLSDGESIEAGESVFIVRRVGDDVAKMPAAANIIRALGDSQPLYAILDAARTTRVIELLSTACEQVQCLYDGDSAVELAACAPYLVRMPAKSRLLRKLVREGWGRSWGVYLLSRAPFEAVRKHLRHFLMVDTEDGPKQYFRFYDPRVLPVFLATCNTKQHQEFWGPVERYWADSLEPIHAPDFVRQTVFR